MKTWQRIPSPLPRRCGLCGEQMPVGTPMCVYAIGRVTRVRCAACEGAPAPPDLPELPVIDTTPMRLPLVRFMPEMLPLDWKQQAAHERDPGEEG
jgi:hypothetical protein